jgi:hypothetical protein
MSVAKMSVPMKTSIPLKTALTLLSLMSACAESYTSVDLTVPEDTPAKRDAGDAGAVRPDAAVDAVADATGLDATEPQPSLNRSPLTGCTTPANVADVRAAAAGFELATYAGGVVGVLSPRVAVCLGVVSLSLDYTGSPAPVNSEPATTVRKEGLAVGTYQVKYVVEESVQNGETLAAFAGANAVLVTADRLHALSYAIMRKQDGSLFVRSLVDGTVTDSNTLGVPTLPYEVVAILDNTTANSRWDVQVRDRNGTNAVQMTGALPTQATAVIQVGLNRLRPNGTSTWSFGSFDFRAR